MFAPPNYGPDEGRALGHPAHRRRLMFLHPELVDSGAAERVNEGMDACPLTL